MSLDKARPLEEIFYDLFQLHYKDLRRYAIAILRTSTGKADIDRAEEAVQETFATAWKKSGDLLASPAPVGWLYTALDYTLKNMIREDRRWSLRVLAAQEAFDLHAVHPAPGADLELEGLVSPEELEILKRLYVNGEPYEDLYRELGISKTAFAKRVQRMKEKFQKNYWESEKNSDPDRELSAPSGRVKNRGGSKK